MALSSGCSNRIAVLPEPPDDCDDEPPLEELPPDELDVPPEDEPVDVEPLDVEPLDVGPPDVELLEVGPSVESEFEGDDGEVTDAGVAVVDRAPTKPMAVPARGAVVLLEKPLPPPAPLQPASAAEIVRASRLDPKNPPCRPTYM